LNELPFPYHAVWRFLPLDRQTARAAIERRRVHWSAASLRPSQLIAKMLCGGGKAEPVDDRFGSKMRRELDEALLYLEEHDTSAGWLTTTLLTFDTDRARAEETAGRLVAELRNRGFLARAESLNAAQAYLGALPGVGLYNVRRPLVVNRTFIDLALTSSVWPGSPTHPSPKLAGHPAHVVAATSGSTPFFLSLAHGDVQHALVVGPTGAGKSVLVNFLIHQFFRYPDAQVLAIDKGWSLYAATLAAGGCHYPLTPDAAEGEEALRFSPLAHLETAADLQAASAWLQELLRLQGLEPTPEIVHQVDEVLSFLQVAPNRTLGTFASKVQHQVVRQALEPYHGRGRLAHLFDGGEAPLRSGPLHVFEMEAVLPLQAKAVVPLVLHLFSEIERRLDGRPTLLVVEEALPYLGDTLWSERFASWLYQLRKANAGVLFVGQSLAAFLDSPLKHPLLESCPTRIFLPNPAARQPETAQAYRTFGLNDRQIEILARATPKRQYFAVTPEGSRLFHLDLSPAVLAVYSLAGPEARRTVAQLQEEHGPGWLEGWLAARGEAGFVELLRGFRHDLGDAGVTPTRGAVGARPASPSFLDRPRIESGKEIAG
jgi:type IV secretion system protein VirB4